MRLTPLATSLSTPLPRPGDRRDARSLSRVLVWSRSAALGPGRTRRLASARRVGPHSPLELPHPQTRPDAALALATCTAGLSPHRTPHSAETALTIFKRRDGLTVDGAGPSCYARPPSSSIVTCSMSARCPIARLVWCPRQLSSSLPRSAWSLASAKTPAPPATPEHALEITALLSPLTRALFVCSIAAAYSSR